LSQASDRTVHAAVLLSFVSSTALTKNTNEEKERLGPCR